MAKQKMVKQSGTRSTSLSTSLLHEACEDFAVFESIVPPSRSGALTQLGLQRAGKKPGSSNYRSIAEVMDDLDDKENLVPAAGSALPPGFKSPHKLAKQRRPLQVLTPEQVGHASYSLLADDAQADQENAAPAEAKAKAKAKAKASRRRDPAGSSLLAPEAESQGPSAGASAPGRRRRLARPSTKTWSMLR